MQDILHPEKENWALLKQNNDYVFLQYRSWDKMSIDKKNLWEKIYIFLTIILPIPLVLKTLYDFFRLEDFSLQFILLTTGVVAFWISIPIIFKNIKIPPKKWIISSKGIHFGNHFLAKEQIKELKLSLYHSFSGNTNESVPGIITFRKTFYALGITLDNANSRYIATFPVIKNSKLPEAIKLIGQKADISISINN